MRKKQKKTMWIIAIIMLLIGIGILAYGFYDGWFKSITVNTNQNNGSNNIPATTNPNQLATCIDSDRYDDSDSQPTIFGTCKSSISGNVPDVCASLTSVSEKSCGTDFYCKSQTISCLEGWVCSGGVCKIPRCEEILNPLDQSDCDIASDLESGQCIFYAQHLSIPAHCSS